jgi:hypothetical protein
MVICANLATPVSCTPRERPSVSGLCRGAGSEDGRARGCKVLHAQRVVAQATVGARAGVKVNIIGSLNDKIG